MCPNANHMPGGKLKDKDLSNWYKIDNIFENMTAMIHKVVLTPEPEILPMSYSSDSKNSFVFVIHTNII